MTTDFEHVGCLFQKSEAKLTWKWVFFNLMQLKLIFTRKVLDVASWEVLELANGLFVLGLSSPFSFTGLWWYWIRFAFPGKHSWLAEMTLVIKLLPRVFQCLFTFALVSTPRWLAEIWQLRRRATGELEVELSFHFLPRRQSAPESLLAG